MKLTDEQNKRLHRMYNILGELFNFTDNEDYPDRESLPETTDQQRTEWEQGRDQLLELLRAEMDAFLAEQGYDSDTFCRGVIEGFLVTFNIYMRHGIAGIDRMTDAEISAMATRDALVQINGNRDASFETAIDLQAEQRAMEINRKQ